MRPRRSEAGVALLLTVFVIAVGTLLVFELGRLARYDQRSARAFAERIQGQYVIRSGFYLSQILLSLPKEGQGKEDWLGDPWSIIGQARELPVAGLPGEPRVQIADESSKFNLNWAGGKSGASDKWRERLVLLFNQLGFVQENFSQNERRTVGGVALDDVTQVAALADWIDEDESSFASPALSAKGFENGAPPGYFFNRELRTFGELLLVPGITRERVARLLPYSRIIDPTGDIQKINVNTARYETLVALGYPESVASEIVLGQKQAPISSERLKEINQIDPTLDAITSVKSREFSVTVRVRLPNSVRWGRAYITVSSGTGTGARSATMRAIEIY
jgi:type II secretory pathway component PulK